MYLIYKPEVNMDTVIVCLNYEQPIVFPQMILLSISIYILERFAYAEYLRNLTLRKYVKNYYF